jgi:hypothetical protein
MELVRMIKLEEYEKSVAQEAVDFLNQFINSLEEMNIEADELYDAIDCIVSLINEHTNMVINE